MASYQQVCYCKKCKTNVGLNDKGQCKRCGSTQITKSWSVRFRYVNEQQKEVQKRLSGFGTKRECQAEYEKFIATAKQYVKLENEAHDLLFSTLYEEYKAFQKPRIKESSYYSFYTKADKHIMPFFKTCKVKNITAKDILNWQNSIEHYSYKYKTNIRQQLTAMLKYAERYYGIDNKIKYVDSFKRKIKKKEMQVWSPDEFNQFIKKVDNEVYRMFFYALYLTGARRGELMATTWNDWDLKKSILNIDKTFTTKNLGTGSGGVKSLPKNEFSIRQISIPQNLNELMQDFKINHFKLPNDRVFDIRETTLDSIKNDACKKADVKQIRIHDFRHSHASLLISEGISIVAVAKRLGHGKIEQTLNTYSHLMPQEDTKLSQVLVNCLKI